MKRIYAIGILAILISTPIVGYFLAPKTTHGFASMRTRYALRGKWHLIAPEEKINLEDPRDPRRSATIEFKSNGRFEAHSGSCGAIDDEGTYQVDGNLVKLQGEKQPTAPAKPFTYTLELSEGFLKDESLPTGSLIYARDIPEKVPEKKRALAILRQLSRD